MELNERVRKTYTMHRMDAISLYHMLDKSTFIERDEIFKKNYDNAI